MDRTTQATDTDSDQVGSLEIKDLGFGYNGSSGQVLSGLSLKLQAGSFAALVGRSGCGKTTLLNILSGYLQASSGRCLVDSEAIDSPSPKVVPIFQVDGLLPWLRVEDNVLLKSWLTNAHKPSQVDRARAAELLKEVGLQPALCGDYPKNLSEGMKKRVEIARALFAAPSLLLADEPFSSLDTETQRLLHTLVLQLWKKKYTILFTTHDLHEALYLSTHVVVMRSRAPSRILATHTNPFQATVGWREGGKEYCALYDLISSQVSSDDQT